LSATHSISLLNSKKSNMATCFWLEGSACAKAFKKRIHCIAPGLSFRNYTAFARAQHFRVTDPAPAAVYSGWHSRTSKDNAELQDFWPLRTSRPATRSPQPAPASTHPKIAPMQFRPRASRPHHFPHPINNRVFPWGAGGRWGLEEGGWWGVGLGGGWGTVAHSATAERPEVKLS